MGKYLEMLKRMNDENILELQSYQREEREETGKNRDPLRSSRSSITISQIKIDIAEKIESPILQPAWNRSK